MFERFADYWDKSSAGNVGRIVFTPIEDEQTRVAALLSGEVDFIAPVSSSFLEQIRSDSNVVLVTTPGTRIITFQMNQQRRPEFRDQRVRMAIVHAVNNEAIAQKIMKGFATPAGQYSPRGVPRLQPQAKTALRSQAR